MRHISGISIILLLVLSMVLSISGCKQKVPVTDAVSFIKNLEKAGLNVEVAAEDSNYKTYAARYVGRYKEAFKNVESSGRTIEPVFLADESKRLADIEASVADVQVLFNDLRVNGEYVYYYEYNTDSEAVDDSEYIKLFDVYTFEVTIPTDSGKITYSLNSMRVGRPHYYRQNNIIVLYLERHITGVATGENNRTIMDTLEEIFGPEFYTL